MPRKSKDKELEINEPKVKKVSKAKATEASVVKATKSVAKPKVEKEKKTATSKQAAKKVTEPAKKVAAKKATKPAKKVSAKKTTEPTKKIATKKSTEPAKKVTTKKQVEKADTKKKATKTTKTAKTTRAKKTSTPIPVLEYYDLPYRYNHTVVKVLAQNPTTLFVYWDINDNDRKVFENNYGNNFFNITKPVLVVHNLTNNYSYEIDINDFANNWYIRDCDTKCKYFIELGRRPIENTQDINTNYVNIAYSNTMEIPNDHILFFKENDKIYFKNIKTNKVTEKTFKNSIYANNLKEIYKNYNTSENQDEFDFENPSSNFLSSNVL